MEELKKYSIPYLGLSLGRHEWEYEIKDAFFEEFEYSEIKKGSVRVILELEKKSNMLLLEFNISGKVNLPCDRCNSNFDLEIEGTRNLIVKFGTEAREESDDVIVIPASDPELDLVQFIYEFINLLVPIKRIHPETREGKNGCDQEVLKKLDLLKVRKENNSDPRWDALKELKK